MNSYDFHKIVKVAGPVFQSRNFDLEDTICVRNYIYTGTYVIPTETSGVHFMPPSNAPSLTTKILAFRL